MSRRVLVVRGGALPRASGLGRAHADLVDRLEAGMVPGHKLAEAIEHGLGGSPMDRWKRRRKHHPRAVVRAAEQERHKFGDSILHITDQEQAHLVPTNSPLPVSITVHDLFHLFPRQWREVEVGEAKPNWIRRRDLAHLRKGIARADLLICISEATAAECRERWPGKPVAVVPHGIDAAGYDPVERPLPKPAVLDPNRLNLLYVGSEAPRKRLDFLVDVLNHLPSHVRAKVALHKVGAESSRAAREALENRVNGFELNWVGRVDDIDLLGWYQHADAFCFPSAAEGFGLPPLEAMASGCPVLVADLPAHNEVSPKEWLLPPTDLDAWVDAICALESRRGVPNQTALNQAQKFDASVWSENISNAWSLNGD